VNKNTGLNTSEPMEDITTVTLDSDKGKENEASITVEVIDSQKTNTVDTSYRIEKSEPPLPIDSMHLEDLPSPVFDMISGIKNAHFIAAVPDESAALVTREAIADIPQGYIVVLVFPNQSENPPKHYPGKVYIIDD
jgi:hypothetical protein